MSARTPELSSIAVGGGFVEGPVITPDGQVFVTSIDHGCVYRVEESGLTLFADVGGGANGATLGADGTIYVAQSGGRLAPFGPRWGPDSVGGIQVVRPDGSVDWLNRDPIAPNDLCFGPDGLLYVTDPTRSPPRNDGRIWRVDPVTGEAELLLSVPWFPNGIGFSADDTLHVASTQEARVVRFTLDDGLPVDPQTVVRTGDRLPDGFAFDVDGNLLVGAIGARPGEAGEIQVWSPEGELLETMRPSPSTHLTNLALSPDRLLVVADSDAGTVLAAEHPVAGLALHPFRAR